MGPWDSLAVLQLGPKASISVRIRPSFGFLEMSRILGVPGTAPSRIRIHIPLGSLWSLGSFPQGHNAFFGIHNQGVCVCVRVWVARRRIGILGLQGAREGGGARHALS